MKTIAHLATLAMLALCAALPAHAAEQDPPITIDTHVDIPFDYMDEPRFDVG
ncbi:MAG TPA: membrane dipeptidase, partial [Rhodanobacter sp.]|nr:membrane dipeptidase [Rhodanobacter sp.]